MVDLRHADHEGFAMSCNLTIMDLEHMSVYSSFWLGPASPCRHYGPLVDSAVYMPYCFHSLTQPASQCDAPIYPPPVMQNLLFANVPSSSASSSLGDLPGLVTLSSMGVLTCDLQKLLDTLEECTACGLMFIAGALCAHIPLCVGAQLEEVKSEGEDEGVDMEKDQGTDKKGKGKAPGQGDGF
ncbi:hypothetical protein BS47DRAFT_1344865 [Hydnum rufescens UP504]|uniref:Uncharacterized protein n=1 Tax=Hydnum rufescens UP504 TaxID=1448309 RepID=A0A9P6AW57_9AGAM|nr:hypothetical protein BS47DRAFT_1344865 [Hydnum rufescens UP504]